MANYLQDGHKMLWHLDRLVQWQQGQLVSPIYVEISPVSYCNHRCVFCGVDFARVGKRRLDTDLTCRRLGEMGRLGVRSMMFAGEGEPLLHSDLDRLMAAAKQAGIDVSLTTNGSLGDAETWRTLLPLLTWVRFSVDAGSGPVYAKVHGVGPESFSRTVASIQAAVETKHTQGLPVTVGVQYLLLPENLDDLGAACELFSGLGVDYVSLKPFSLHPQMIQRMDVDYGQEMIDRVEAILAAAEIAPPTQVIFRRQALLAYRDGKIGFDRCRALPFWGYLHSSGDFYTCSVFLGDERFRAGNLLESSVQEVFQGAARQRSLDFGRHELAPGEQCRLNCRMARINEFLHGLEHPPDHVNFI